jgi:lysyl-tRNA synthetase class 1
MHWADAIAHELMRRGDEHTIATGTSISGRIHLGNAGDVIYGDGVYRSLERLKPSSLRLLWISDDMDPFRRVPAGLDPSYEKYLGMPVSSLPCPEGCCSSFVEHYSNIFLDSLRELGVELEVHSTTQMYQDGIYEGSVKRAIERRDEIIEIYREISGAERPKDWMPFTPVCGNCGRISTVRSLSYENGKVEYRCEGGIVRGKWLDGCGYKGSSDLRRGKLSWRVEWAARWAIFRVTCEPFGKEHRVSGGSYDTSSIISERIFSWKAPVPLRYEHILVGGRKMAKSIGNIMAVEDLLNYLQPEVIRFFFYRSRPITHKDFDMKKLLQLIEEYEHVERIFYGVERPSPREDGDELKRIYELSQVDGAKEFIQAPFRSLIYLVQVSDDVDWISSKLGVVPDKIEKKIQLAKRLVDEFCPPEMRFKIAAKPPEVELSPKQRTLLIELSELPFDDLLGREDEVQKEIKETSSRLGISPKDAYRAIYLVLLGKDHGPKVTTLMNSLDGVFLKKRFRLEG